MLEAALRSAPPKVRSPYPGLVPYSEEDASYFFGREHDRGIIAANLQASRLTVLYGASGVGKSSVLRAGVVHTLRRQAREQVAAGGNPQSMVVEFATWRDDPIAGLTDAIRRSVELTASEPIISPPPTRELDRLLGQWTERLDADLLIILDQFEEYFLYHGGNDAEDFGVQFPIAVNTPDLRANFLLAIREDALAKLDRFKGQIPNLFGNYLRIRHLDTEAGRDAITLPIRQYNTGADKPVAIEPELVDEVLDQVKIGQLQVGGAGRGGMADSDRDGGRIETPYLQLVMSRLWREEKASERECVLRFSTLERLGGAERIVRTHLDEAMEALAHEQASVAARIFRFLVTRGGGKVAHTAADLADWAGVGEQDVEAVLERLARGDVRILRVVAPPPGEAEVRFEIFHDVLASAVLDWRARYEQRRRQQEAEDALNSERRKAEERANKARRRTRALAGLLGAAMLAIGAVLWLFFWALGQRDAARSEALVGRSLSALSVDPRRSVRLALQAHREKRTRAAEAVLRQALPASRVERVLAGHDDIVWTAAFSPDGTRVVTASEDGTARVTSVASGDPIVTLQGHEGGLTGAAFGPDGTTVVTTSMDGTARVWNGDTGEQIHVLTHGSEVWLTSSDQFLLDGGYVATGPFSADGRYLVTVAGDSAWLWDLASGANPLRFQDRSRGHRVLSAAFSPDGRSIVTGGYRYARVWDTRTGVELRKAKLVTDAWVNQAVFSPAGDVVATAHSDGSVGLWKKGQPVRVEFGHSDDVRSVSFSASGEQLVSAGDKTARVWDAALLELTSVTEGFASWINMAAFSPDGRYVVSANQDGISRVWEAATGRELFPLQGHRDVVWQAQFSPDGDRVITASEDGSARIWNVDTGTELRGHGVAVDSAAFSPDATLILTAGADRAVVWDASSGDMLRSMVSAFAVNDAGFNPEGDRVLVATESGLLPVEFWNAGRGNSAQDFCCSHEEYLAAIGADFSPVVGDDRILVLYRDGSAQIWDTSGETEEVLHQLGDAEDRFILATFTPDGRRVVTAGRFDKRIRLWDVDTGEEIGDGWPAGLVVNLDVSPTNRQIATGGTDGIVRLWDIRSGTQVGRSMRGIAGQVTSVAFNGNGRRVLAGGSDGSVRIWDAFSQRPLAVLRPHADGVNSVAYGVDGLILSASDDRTAKTYDCETCVRLNELARMAQRHLARTDPGG